MKSSWQISFESKKKKEDLKKKKIIIQNWLKTIIIFKNGVLWFNFPQCAFLYIGCDSAVNIHVNFADVVKYSAYTFIDHFSSLVELLFNELL